MMIICSEKWQNFWMQIEAGYFQISYGKTENIPLRFLNLCLRLIPLRLNRNRIQIWIEFSGNVFKKNIIYITIARLSVLFLLLITISITFVLYWYDPFVFYVIVISSTQNFSLLLVLLKNVLTTVW